MIFLDTHQIVLYRIRCPTPQNFTNAYLLITSDKATLTFESADGKAAADSARFTFTPFSPTKVEVQTLQKPFKKCV